MVTLVQENRNAPRTFRGVRVVKFRDIGDIRRQLAIAAGPTSTLNPGATPFIPIQAPPQSNSVELSVEATSDDPEENEDDASEVAAEEEDTEPHEEADVSAIIESIGANFTAPSADALAKQDSAARTLQTHYRRLLTNRAKRIANGLGLPKTRQNQFEAFARAAESMEWPQKSPYRPIFLGALPHLLTCLDHAWSIVMEEKNKVKRQARSSDKHQGIEGLMERQTNLKYVHNWLERMKTWLTNAGHDSDTLKRIKPLQTSLEASSSLHRDRDLKQLGVHLVNVSAIIDEIPQAKEELAFDLEMACAWRIYVENRQKPKVEKPVLNTDDLDGMF
jgi:hypothetical protein